MVCGEYAGGKLLLSTVIAMSGIQNWCETKGTMLLLFLLPGVGLAASGRLNALPVLSWISHLLRNEVRKLKVDESTVGLFSCV